MTFYAVESGKSRIIAARIEHDAYMLIFKAKRPVAQDSKCDRRGIDLGNRIAGSFAEAQRWRSIFTLAVRQSLHPTKAKES